MNATTQRSPTARQWLICFLLLLASAGALAQTAVAGSIQIQTPKLPPRPGTSPPSAPAAATAYGQQGPAPQSTNSYATQQGQPAYQNQGQQSGITSQAGYGSYGSTAPAFAGSSGPAPTRAASGGPCRVEVSPDRQNLSLLGTSDALPRQFLPLGEFRAQQVVHSPDGRWAVAFLKLRGQSQFAMLTLDLTSCKEQSTIDLAHAGEDASFDGDNVTVRSGGKDQRWPLADKRVR
jgi:hypothetical protein